MSLVLSGILSATCYLCSFLLHVSPSVDLISNFFSIHVIRVYTKLRPCTACCCIQLVCPSFGRLRESHHGAFQGEVVSFPCLVCLLEQRKQSAFEGNWHSSPNSDVLFSATCCKVTYSKDVVEKFWKMKEVRRRWDGKWWWHVTKWMLQWKRC